MQAYTHWRNKLFASKESKKVGSRIEFVIPSKDLWKKAYNNMRLVVPYDYFDRGKKAISMESFDKSIRKELKRQIGSELWTSYLIKIINISVLLNSKIDKNVEFNGIGIWYDRQCSRVDK